MVQVIVRVMIKEQLSLNHSKIMKIWTQFSSGGCIHHKVGTRLLPRQVKNKHVAAMVAHN
jgi:hypothetical protein